MTLIRFQVEHVCILNHVRFNSLSFEWTHLSYQCESAPVILTIRRNTKNWRIKKHARGWKWILPKKIRHHSNGYFDHFHFNHQQQKGGIVKLSENLYWIQLNVFAIYLAIGWISCSMWMICHIVGDCKGQTIYVTYDVWWPSDRIWANKYLINFIPPTDTRLTVFLKCPLLFVQRVFCFRLIFFFRFILDIWYSL